MVVVARNHLQIIWSKLLGVKFLYAVDKLDGGGIAILREEGNGDITSLDGFEDIADGLIDKEGILYLVLRFLTLTAVESLDDICIVGLAGNFLLDALVLAVALCLALLEEGGDLGGGHEFLRLLR